VPIRTLDKVFNCFLSNRGASILKLVGIFKAGWCTAAGRVIGRSFWGKMTHVTKQNEAGSMSNGKSCKNILNS